MPVLGGAESPTLALVHARGAFYLLSCSPSHKLLKLLSALKERNCHKFFHIPVGPSRRGGGEATVP